MYVLGVDCCEGEASGQVVRLLNTHFCLSLTRGEGADLRKSEGQKQRDSNFQARCHLQTGDEKSKGHECKNLGNTVDCRNSNPARALLGSVLSVAVVERLSTYLSRTLIVLLHCQEKRCVAIC